MAKTIRFLIVALLLPALAVIVLAVDAHAATKGRKVYRINLSTTVGGPVRSVLPAGAPASLLVRSTPELDAQDQTRLAWHFRNAAHLADRFAKKHGLRVVRQKLPNRVEIFGSTGELADAMMMPTKEYGCKVVARIDLQMGVVFLGRSDTEDLYVELGKWFFYAANYQWGHNRRQDMAMLNVAERFADFCMDKDNWVEANGSTKDLF